MSEFHAIGIDVGGTKIAGGCVSFPEGRVCSSRTIPTAPARGGQAVLDDVVELAHSLESDARNADHTIGALGIGICELVNPSGTIISANCISWLDQPVKARLSSIAPVTLEADVRAAARAEAMFGAGRDLQVFLYVTIGTGISCSLVSHGEPFVGAHGATGTMASTPLRLTCPRCGFLNHQSLEDIASGPGLVQQYNQLRTAPVTTGQAVLAAAATGNPDALKVVNTGAESLEAVIGLLINVLDPQAVIVGGGLGLSDGPFWNRFVASTRRHTWAAVHRDLPFLRATTGAQAGFLGAAAAAWIRSSSYSNRGS